MSNTIQRIKKFIDYKHISVRKFEMSIGFSNGAFATQYKKNKTIGSDKLEKILQEYRELNPIWLLTGEGTMLLQEEYKITGKVINPVSESNTRYDKLPDYLQKYINQLETEVDMLRTDVKQKQSLIDGFISGSIVRI